MNFRNKGLDKVQKIYFFKPHQIKAVLDSNIEFDDYDTIFTGVSKLADSDTIDIAVTQYAIECKLGLSVNDHSLYLEDQVIGHKINNAIGKLNRFDLIKDINAHNKFYVRKHPNGFELVMAKITDGNEDVVLPKAITECVGGWVRVSEPCFNTALLRSIYHTFGYHTVHFKDTPDFKQGNWFTLADVFKLLV